MSEPAAEEQFALRALRAGDKVGKLKHGEDEFLPLKMFAKRKASKFEAAHLARTYVVEEASSKRLVAYITLTCSEVCSKEELLDGAIGYQYPAYPAVKVARLMVDADYRGPVYGLGRKLMDFAAGIARTEICPAVGCRFVVVDAKRQSVGFYQKIGYTILDTEENKTRDAPVLFLDLYKAAS